MAFENKQDRNRQFATRREVISGLAFAQSWMESQIWQLLVLLTEKEFIAIVLKENETRNTSL